MLRRRLYILTLLGSILLAGFAKAALATTAVVPSDDEMVVESRAIVTGRVLGLSTALDSNTDRVYTYIRLEVNTVLKGEITDREIVLKELGGETHDRGTLIFGMPRFEPGQDVLVYLNTWPDGALRVHQGFLGKFNINHDSTGRSFVERQIEGESVIIIADSTNNGTNRSELDGYVQMVTSSMETNRKNVRRFERYYSTVPMLAHPIEYTSSHAEITPQFAYLNPSSPARWFEADSNQPVVFYVNPAGAPSFAALQDDMQAAMNAWSTAGGSIRVTYGGTTGGCGVYVADGLNTISFNNCDNYFAPSQSCAGLIAVSGIIKYVTDDTKYIGGATFAKAIEANVSFNPYGLCNIRNRVQLQEVATHELGHALGLGHSSDPSATMVAYVHFDNRGASLKLDDVQGITNMYPAAPSAGQLSITTSELPELKPDNEYAVNFEASGGTGGYQWDLVGGTLPSGLRLAMSGFLFGKTSTTGTFDFTVQVRDSMGNSSQRMFTLGMRPPNLPAPPPNPAPAITAAEYKKKKVSVSGRDFQADAKLYLDGENVPITSTGTTLTTDKKKLKAGTHQLYVVNPDGRQSNSFPLVIE